MKRFLYKILQWPTRMFNQLIFRRNLHKLTQIVGPSSPSHQKYLQLQLERTTLKRATPLQKRTQNFIDHLSGLVQLSECRVLCIGCRNTAELDYFHAKGCNDVTGIDLHSPRADILIMDMHHMNFPKDDFDIVYSSHSLEHSRDPAQVIKAIINVVRTEGLIAIEVPINFEPRGTDLIDFKSLDNLYQEFREALPILRDNISPAQIQVLWSEQYQAAGNERNHCIRAIFRINK
jgi:SAM-dependent methyltransferase